LCDPAKSCASARPRSVEVTLIDTLLEVAFAFATRAFRGFAFVVVRCVVVGVDWVVETVGSGAVVVAGTVVVAASVVAASEVVCSEVVCCVVVCAVVVGAVVVVGVVVVVVDPSLTESDPFMEDACASHWKWYVPGCNVTDQLSEPVPLMLVLSSTPGPLRWKLCMLEWSETLIV
jgi:hypothetical protein